MNSVDSLVSNVDLSVNNLDLSVSNSVMKNQATMDHNLDYLANKMEMHLVMMDKTVTYLVRESLVILDDLVTNQVTFQKRLMRRMVRNWVLQVSYQLKIKKKSLLRTRKMKIWFKKITWTSW